MTSVTGRAVPQAAGSPNGVREFTPAVPRDGPGARMTRREEIAIGSVTVSRCDSDRSWLIALEGEHDMSTVPLLDRETCAVWLGCQLAVVDLSAAAFIDTSVINWLLRTNSRLAVAGQGKLRVVHGPPGSAASRLLRLVGLEERLDCYPTQTQAFAAGHALGNVSQLPLPVRSAVANGPPRGGGNGRRTRKRVAEMNAATLASAVQATMRESSSMRTVNTNMRDVSAPLALSDPIAFFCECGSPSCYSPVWMSAEVFDATVAGHSEWMLLAGHQPSAA
jgi:hypothetical protein